VRNMQITKVEVIPFGIPISAFTDAYTVFNRSDAVLVRIYANDGTVGTGEACAWEPEFYGETLESITSSMRKYVAPRIIGKDPLDIDEIMSTVDGVLAKSTCVKEGLDLALFDLAAKSLKVPVYTMLHGHYRDKIPIACEVGIDRPEIMVEKAREMVEMGVRVIKLKCSRDTAKDIEMVKAVHRAFGEKAELRLDPNAHWDTCGTIKAMRELEDCNIQYLEQPVAAWDLTGMNRIRRSIDVPLMADESVWTPQDVVELAKHEAADIVNIKIAKTGGLSLAKKVEAVASAFGMPCVVGTELEPGISLAAKIHLAASIRDLPYSCEFTELFHLKESVIIPQVRIENGCISVPKGIGYGVQIDQDILMRNSIDV